MDTRENKYSSKASMSRVAKNENLYKEINDSELDNFTVKSNAEVIGNQEREIDVEQIKKLLEKRYNEAPKRKSIKLEEPEEVNKVPVDDTKEYDLSKVLEKAKDEKQVSYEEERAKKLRNTQYDILNNLNIDGEDKEEKKESKSVKTTSESDLIDLINTITINEEKNKEEENEDSDGDPLDILTDLKGSENTQVYDSMASEVSASIDVIKKELEEEEEYQNIKKVVEAKEEVKLEPKEETKDTIDNSFYTSNVFKKKDFENEDDFIDDDKLNLGLKVLIGVVLVGFLLGLFLFLKSFIGF